MDRRQLYAALRTAVAAAWPEVVPNGIRHDLQQARLPFEQMAAEGKIPFAVIDVDLRSSAEWGADNDAEVGPVRLYYVVSSAEGVDGLEERLEALRAHLWATGLDFGQVLDWPSTSLSLELTPNRIFAFRQLPFLAGMVEARVLIGDMGAA